MKVLLVEDDPAQAEALIEKLKKYLGAHTSIVGPYNDFQQILPHIKNYNFELALIDIQLGDDVYAGIHIAETIQQFSSIPIIFVSGITDENIIKKADKIKSDFLQKPFDSQSFQRAVSRAVNMNFLENREIKVAFKPRGRDKFWVKTERSKFIGVEPKDILCVEAMDHYCKFHILNQKPLLTKTSLQKGVLENGLSSYSNFLLLNRSMVVNLNAIDRVDGNLLVIDGLEKLDQRRLTIPKEKRKEIFNALGIGL